MATPVLDMANPQKNPNQVYDSQVLLGTVLTNGSVSSAFDIGGWTNFALKIDANGGTILGGTVVNIWGALSLQDTFVPLFGTTGNTASSFQIGSTGTQFYGPLTVLQPHRFIKFVLPGTQSAAVNLNLIVK